VRRIEGHPDNVTLYAGQAMVQNAPGPLSRIAVATAGAGRENRRQAGLVMIGEKPGDTSIHLWMDDGSQRSIAGTSRGNSAQVTEAVRQCWATTEHPVSAIGGT